MRAAKSSSRAKRPVTAAATRALTVAKTAVKKANARSGGVGEKIGGMKRKTAQVLARNPFRTALGALALGFVFAKLKTIF